MAFSGLFDFSSNRPVEPYKEQAQQSRGRFANLVEDFRNRGQRALDQPTLTAEDLFGEQMQNLKDRSNQQANATKQALTRALMAGGGQDISGAQAVNMSEADEQSAENVMDIQTEFENMARKIDRARRQRGQQMLSKALQGRQNIMGADISQAQRAEKLHLQEEQAKKQRATQLVGGIINTAGTVAAALCWMAEELFGPHSHKTNVIRGELIMREDEDSSVGKFARDYRKNGKEWAKVIKVDQKARDSARKVLNTIYNQAGA